MKPLKPNARRGMTLVELLIAMTIGVFAITGALRLVVQTLRTYQYETGKLLVNRDIRRFTEMMIDDATYANGFYIFDQKSNLERKNPLDTTITAANSGTLDPTTATYRGYTTDKQFVQTNDTVSPATLTSIGTEAVSPGVGGDVVVFVYNKDGDNEKIQQLIIYFRDIDTTTASNGTNSTDLKVRARALRRIVVKPDYSDSNSANITKWKAANLWKLLPDLTKITTTRDGNDTPKTISLLNQTIFPFVDGQANDATASIYRRNKMFFNMNGTSVLIRGRIYENYTPTSAIRLVKSTYNFTVTPRG